MDTEYESSRIERAKRSLYKPGEEKAEAEYRQDLTPSNIEVANNWGDTTIVTERKQKRGGGVIILKTLVVLALLATVGSGGYLLYQLLDPLARPSDKNIQITFDVPVGITPGVPADVVVHVSNQNRVPLEFGNLTMIYPPGTRSVDDPNKDAHDEKKVLGEIAAGQVVDYHTKAIFLGEENADKELRARLEFRFGSINSVFTKDVVRSIHLLAAPINLTVDMLKEVNSGQEVTLSATALSNTVIPLRDILVKVEYPLGFNYIDADPPPSFGNNIWRIGTMAPTGKFNVKIRGTLAGEDTQEKVFHTAIGVGADQASRAIDISYGSVLSSVILQRPFIGISLSMNGKLADQAVARFGQRIGGVVNWSNNLNTKIVNAQIEVHLSGVALDRKTVIAADGGFFRSTDNTIFWDERAEKHLSEIEAGGSGSVSFSFLPVPSVTNNTLLTSPIITAEVTVRGKRISEAGVPEEIKTEFTQEVKITSEAQIAARLVHYVGPFVNTGPMPPKVEQETSYTVIWDIMNTSNSIKNAVVHAGIPSFVTWAGSIFPSNENIVYDPATNQITWSPGDIPAGTGVTSAPREVAFQLIFTPGLTQVGQVPALINKIHFDGVDTFTGAALSQDKGELTTSLSTDPKALPSTASVAP